MTQNFLQLIEDKPATIINITSTAGILTMPTTGSYALSKLVQIQIQRFVEAENPNVVALSMQPGSVLTSITKPAFVKFSKDTHELAGGTAVVSLTNLSYSSIRQSSQLAFRQASHEHKLTVRSSSGLLLNKPSL